MQKQKVDVNFTYFDHRYDMDNNITLGETNLESAIKILQQVSEYKPAQSPCVCSLDAQLCGDTAFYANWANSPIDISLNFSDMSFPPAPQRALCMAQYAKLPRTKENMLHTCAHNFRCGKCQDKFMRHVIGTVLYPHLYTNQKVK